MHQLEESMTLYKSLRDRLENQHEAIDYIIRSMESSRLNLKPQADKWSIHDNIAHLARYQVIFLDRINAILKANHPKFDRYNAANDPDFETWRRLNTEDLLRTLKKDRATIFDFLTNLTATNLDLTGHHPKLGTLTLIEWTEFFILHEAHHIYTIFQISHDIENNSAGSLEDIQIF